jgi:predicted small lipoprotein YifL
MFMSRGFILIAMLLLATMALTACGKRGTLEAPPAEVAPSGKSASVEPKPNEKPHRPFVLDPLLR